MAMRATRQSVLAAVLLFVGELAVTQVEGTDPVDHGPWYARGDSKYMHITTLSTWDAAQATCVALGANLVSLQTAEEEKFVHATVLGGASPRTWTGCNDRAAEGKFVWVGSDGGGNGSCTKGESGVYSNWKNGEPNNAPDGEHCVELMHTFHLDSGFQMNDFPCEHPLGYVCEVDANSLRSVNTLIRAVKEAAAAEAVRLEELQCQTKIDATSSAITERFQTQLADNAAKHAKALAEARAEASTSGSRKCNLTGAVVLGALAAIFAVALVVAVLRARKLKERCTGEGIQGNQQPNALADDHSSIQTSGLLQ